jgi:ABC-type nitrate/sulfonate/bicarbonate transport system permease component
MIPRWLVAIRGRVPRRAALVLGLIPIVVVVVVWWAITRGEQEERIVSSTILPSPVEVIKSVPLLITRRNLMENTLISLRRVGLGYVLAVALVLPLGILMGAFGVFRAMFAPTTTASGYIPIATLVPLTMSWFGTGEKQKVVFLAMAFGVYLLPMIIEAIDDVPDVYVRTASTLGASRLDIVRRVLVPVAMPAIWQGMRMAFGVGWTYLVLTEVVVMEGGLGEVIAMSQRRGPREHVYLVIILITLIAWAADIVWVQVGQLIFPYRRGR